MRGRTEGGIKLSVSSGTSCMDTFPLSLLQPHWGGGWGGGGGGGGEEGGRERGRGGRGGGRGEGARGGGREGRTEGRIKLSVSSGTSWMDTFPLRLLQPHCSNSTKCSTVL